LPPEKIKVVVEKDLHSKNLSFADVLYLKEYFGVSTPDMLHTLKHLAYIPNSKYEAYLKIRPSLNDDAYFGDPGGELRPLKKKNKAIPSKRFMSLAFEAFQKRKISEERKDEICLQIDRK